MAVHFYEETEDGRLRFAVILVQTGGRHVFCKHRDGDTLEFPGEAASWRYGG